MSKQILKSDFIEAISKNKTKFDKKHNSSDWYTPYKDFQEAFEQIKNGQTVVEIAGADLGRMFLAKNRVGDKGKVIVIDEEPDFPYNLAAKLVGQGKLRRTKDYYVNSVDGRKELQECFSQSSFYIFGKHIPPYPSIIANMSVDHVIVLDPKKPFLQSIIDIERDIYGPKPEPEKLIEETYKKLKFGGTLTTISSMEDDIVSFDLCLYNTSKRKHLNFEENEMERNILWKWKTYIKSPIKERL